MGNTTATSNTYVANASGMPIRVYYSVDEVQLEEVVVDIGAGVEGSESGVGGSVNVRTNLVFKADSRVRYIRIPVDDYCKFSGEGVIYASIFLESCSMSDGCVKTIALNYHIPIDRSFIVTANHNIKFQKYGANIWMDEDGIMHH